MTQPSRRSLDQHRTAIGVHRKALERAVASAIRQWHEGADGNVLIGKIEQQFFPGQAGDERDEQKRGQR